MSSTGRDLPTGVYRSNSRFSAILRHKGKRYFLGTFDTVEEANHQCKLFRKEHPRTVSKAWKPGDKI